MRTRNLPLSLPFSPYHTQEPGRITAGLLVWRLLLGGTAGENLAKSYLWGMKTGEAEPGKRVLMLVDAAFPADIRVRKEAETLVRHGYALTVVCREKSKVPKELERVHIVPVPMLRHKYLRGIADVINSVIWINLPFYFTLKRLQKHTNWDIIHVHDLPLANTGLKFQTEGARSVLDLHENTPSALKAWFELRKNIIIKLKNKIFFSYNKWSKYESRMTAAFDAVITVVEEMKERLVGQGCDAKKICIISNYENDNFALNKCLNKEILPDGKYILYIGNYGPHRGLDTVIRAMALRSHIPEDLRFVIAGVPNNQDTNDSLNSLINELKLNNKIVFTGKVDFSCFYFMMENAWANIIPHRSNTHTESTIPHKFYQSLMTGKPLLVSSCAPLKRFSETFDLAAVFEAGNPESLALEIKGLAENYPQAMERAKRGKDFSFENSWEKKELLLLDLYGDLSPQPPRTHQQ